MRLLGLHLACFARLLRHRAGLSDWRWGRLVFPSAMSRPLAKSTIKKFKEELEVERERLQGLIEEMEREIEEARNSETAADRSSDPENADAGSMRLEYAKELSIERNTADLLHKVEHALRRIESGGYGICEVCGEPIPVARLEVLPYATMCVTCASKS